MSELGKLAIAASLYAGNQTFEPSERGCLHIQDLLLIENYGIIYHCCRFEHGAVAS
jgi:hypothetical protein